MGLVLAPTIRAAKAVRAGRFRILRVMHGRLLVGRSLKRASISRYLITVEGSAEERTSTLTILVWETRIAQLPYNLKGMERSTPPLKRIEERLTTREQRYRRVEEDVRCVGEVASIPMPVAFVS